MLTQTQEQILAFLLSHQEERLTIRGIARRLGKSYTLVYNNLAGLEKNEIIKKQNVPPAQIITLNEYAPTYLLIGIELKRRKDFLQKHPWIEVLLNDTLNTTKNHFFILLIFGSYAKGTQTSKSDLDMLIIVQDKKDISEIETTIHQAYAKVKKGLNCVDINDFKKMILHPTALNIGNEARNHHLILYGVEEYYQIIKTAYKK